MIKSRRPAKASFLDHHGRRAGNRSHLHAKCPQRRRRRLRGDDTLDYGQPVWRGASHRTLLAAGVVAVPSVPLTNDDITVAVQQKTPCRTPPAIKRSWQMPAFCPATVPLLWWQIAAQHQPDPAVSRIEPIWAYPSSRRHRQRTDYYAVVSSG